MGRENQAVGSSVKSGSPPPGGEPTASPKAKRASGCAAVTGLCCAAGPGSHGEEHPLAQDGKSRASVGLTFHELELVDEALRWAVRPVLATLLIRAGILALSGGDC